MTTFSDASWVARAPRAALAAPFREQTAPAPAPTMYLGLDGTGVPVPTDRGSRPGAAASSPTAPPRPARSSWRRRGRPKGAPPTRPSRGATARLRHRRPTGRPRRRCPRGSRTAQARSPSQPRRQVRDDRELHRSGTRIAGAVLRRPGRDVHRNGAPRFPGRDRRGVARVAPLQLRRAEPRRHDDQAVPAEPLDQRSTKAGA